jgi:hypothetical protein
MRGPFLVAEVRLQAQIETQRALSSASLMFPVRSLHRVVYALLVLGAASQSALALQGSDTFLMIAAKRPSLVVIITGRKGTRNYMPDADEISVEVKKNAPQSAEARLDQCMASWDRNTHITQSNWRQICEREIKANQ